MASAERSSNALSISWSWAFKNVLGSAGSIVGSSPTTVSGLTTLAVTVS